MSKLSRSVLKEIVKECIVEIFQESFFDQNMTMISESSSQRQKSKKRRPNVSSQRNRKTSIADNITYGETQTPAKNESFDRKIDNIASNMTQDPVFADIFRDTANTTLQNQINAESGGRMKGMIQGAGDRASHIVSNSDPTELFAESANKWAALAFSDRVNK